MMSNYICPHNCAYRTNAGYCGMSGGYENCQYIKYLEKLEKEKTNIKPYAGKRTNADRIRAMTDEELAKWICDQIIDRNIGIPSETWLDWLKEKAGTDAESV